MGAAAFILIVFTLANSVNPAAPLVADKVQLIAMRPSWRRHDGRAQL